MAASTQRATRARARAAAAAAAAVALLLLAARAHAQAAACNVFVADGDGVVAMDSEQRGPGGGWHFDTALRAFLGSGYLSYKPYSAFGGTEPKPSSMFDARIKSFFFTVNVSGTYRLALRSAAPHPTEHNDVWVALPESGALKRRFGAESHLTWPAARDAAGGVQLFPEHWFKLYQNTGGWAWHWGGKTVDHNGHDVLTRTLLADGTWYSVRIAGRSTQFAIDRITLFLCAGAECDDGSPRFNAATKWRSGAQSACE